MTFIELKALTEHIDVKKGGLVTYTTGQVIDRPGIILSNNPVGDVGLVLIDQVHNGGEVIVRMRPVGAHPVKKYQLNDIIAQIAVF